MQFADWCAPWKIADGAEDLVLQAPQYYCPCVYNWSFSAEWGMYLVESIEINNSLSSSHNVVATTVPLRLPILLFTLNPEVISRNTGCTCVTL
jgi:hypothetical protein